MFEFGEIVESYYQSHLTHLSTFLSLACIHVGRARYGQETLLKLIVRGTSQYFLSLACRHVGLGRDCHKRLFRIINRTRHIRSILSYSRQTV